MRKMTWIAVIALVGLFVAAACWADGAKDCSTWDFSSPSGELGFIQSYKDSTNSVTIIAAGAKTTIASPSSASLGQSWGPDDGFDFKTGFIIPNKLYGKAGGPDESGLGLSGLSSDNEIVPKSFVQLEVADLFCHGLHLCSLTIDSAQANEGFTIWGSNIIGIPGKLLAAGSNPGTGGTTQTVSIPDDYLFYTVSASSGDVLIKSASACASCAVPEPGSMALLLMGLVPMAGFLRKRRTAA